MAPRTRAKKPVAEQIYSAKPALVQKRLPNRRTKVTYKPERRLLEKRQSTLTQIDFGKLSSREQIDDSDEDDFDEEEAPRKRARFSNRTPQSAMTQTLTQMQFVTSSVRSRPVQDSEEEGLLSDEEELAPHPGTNDLDLQHTPRKPLEIADSMESLETTKSQQAGGNPENGKGSHTVPITNDSSSRADGRAMLPPILPQTPKRVRILAVPSSQTPPTTPLSTQQSPRCPGSANDRSPLQERSTNLLITKERLEHVQQPVIEPKKSGPVALELKTAARDSLAIESPTKKRARDFRAQMDALRNGGALQQKRRKTGHFERNQVIRSSTNVSLVSEEGENEPRNTRPKTGETQFAIGEETQAILGGIDLSGNVVQEPEDEQEEDEEEEEDHQDQTTNSHVNGDQDDDPIFEIGEPQEPLADEHEVPRDLTGTPERDGLQSRGIYPRESSPELPFDNYEEEEEERVPSSQNETPRGTRIIHDETTTTTQGRRVTFSDVADQLMLPVPRSPTSTIPAEVEMDTQESIDPASAQLLYESQAYAVLAASSPIDAQPTPISSPEPAPRSNPMYFRTPRLPRIGTQVQSEEETQAPSTGRTESLSMTSGTYPKSALKGGRKSQAKTGSSSQAHIHSSPLRPCQELPRSSSPRTPSIFRFLKGPITISQLIPDSLRSDLDDGIGLPPRWTQEEDNDDEL